MQMVHLWSHIFFRNMERTFEMMFQKSDTYEYGSFQRTLKSKLKSDFKPAMELLLGAMKFM